MRKHSELISTSLAALAVCAGCTPSPETRIARHEATIERYCTACHNRVDREGDLTLEGADLAGVGPQAATFEKVLRKLDGRLMPPPGEPRPDERTYGALVEFLERSLDEAAAERPPAGRSLSAAELAERLAAWLWRGAPDDALTALAEQGRLGDPGVYAAQIRRMLDDPRSSALVEHLAAEWLGLRRLDRAAPDAETFPSFDEDLRRAMRRETTLFLESIVREDRSVVELLTADFTFLNDGLAEHYGLPGVYGSHFRRYRHRDPNRRGLLGHASILTLTSNPARTSPVRRGRWVLENLLGASVPAPPPGVPALAAADDSGAPRTVRERLERHSADPACAHCHGVIDPIGLALEPFDAVGRWRTHEAAGAIDASGRLVDGTFVDGPAALREAIAARPERFVRVVVGRLLALALGRELEPADMPAVRAITRAAAADDYRFSVLIDGIVASRPFRTAGADQARSNR